MKKLLIITLICLLFPVALFAEQRVVLAETFGYPT
jgi:hypothetical protein